MTPARGVVQEERPIQPDHGTPHGDELVWLTIREAANDAGTTTRTVRRWIAAGRLRTRRINGLVFVAWADLNRTEAATRRHGGRPRKWTE